GGLVGVMTLAYLASQYRQVGLRTVVSRLVRVTVPAAGVFTALLGPYLWLDYQAFYDSTIGVLAKAPLRRDAMSLVGLWLNTTRIEPSGAALAIFGFSVNLLSIGGTSWWLFRSENKSPLNWTGAL